MDKDHERIDKQWCAFMAEATNAELASCLFLEFSNHIQKHINLEDNVLFPRFEKYTGLDKNTGIIAIMRNDHKNILKLLGSVRQARETNDIKKIREAGFHLHRALNAHNKREDTVPYPLFDELFSDAEWTSILTRARAEA